jgi:hypothetical protein
VLQHQEVLTCAERTCRSAPAPFVEGCAGTVPAFVTEEDPVAHYLLSVITPADGEAPSDDQLQAIMGRVAQLQQDMQDAGVWVFSGGLEAPDTATVLARSGDDVLVTDGPFVELKEYVGGLTIIDAPDLDVALHWGRRSTEAIGLPIEVRPFHWAP